MYFFWLTNTSIKCEVESSEKKIEKKGIQWNLLLKCQRAYDIKLDKREI